MRILVAHPAQQHSYRLAEALSGRGMLCAYATTVYYKKHSLTTLAAYFLRGTMKMKAQGRVSPVLRPEQVVQFCELEGLLKLLTMHVRFLRPLYRPIKYHTADRFARKVARYAIREKVDAVVCYDDCSARLFAILNKKAPNILRIMDVSAASILYMKEIYERDMALSPDFAARLRQERAIVWDSGCQSRARQELALSHYMLAPSGFVRTSLLYSGGKAEQIRLCPYGVDTGAFSCKPYDHEKEIRGRPVRFIYVGGVKELKGISYLLRGIMEIPPEQAQLTVVGKYDPGDRDTEPYGGRVQFTGMVLHQEIPKLLREADVFVMPSLGEGMSLSALEAAACGLPLLVTENSGVGDAIKQGREGFIIPIQSSEAIAAGMRWFIHHPERIEPMGRAARAMAQEYTWSRYQERASGLLRQLIEEAQACTP